MAYRNALCATGKDAANGFERAALRYAQGHPEQFEEPDTMEPAATAVADYPLAASAADRGLKANILSPTETLAQSISTIAPTTTPAMTIPLVFALAGNGTWLAYVFAMIAVLLIALCISRFARYTSCSGSLYTYATAGLPGWASGLAGWGLLLAYVATGASVAGGFINYGNVLLQQVLGHAANTALLAVVCVAAATLVAYRDVQVSARLMLWIEAVSVLCIVVVLALLVCEERDAFRPCSAWACTG